MKLHLLYNKEDNKVISEDKDFDTLQEAEQYLDSVGAIYWEIGLPKDYRDRQ